MGKKILIWTLLILLFSALFLGGIFSDNLFRNLKTTYFNPLKNDKGRVNFLILGINGSGGLDKDLTDTIIFASLNKGLEKIVLVSVPRDLWIEEIKAKVNTAYHYGGVDLAQKTLTEVLGQPIHYYAVVNFDNFEKIIDFLGGVEVKVETAFDDYEYPIPGRENDLCDGDKELKCRYEHLFFEAGSRVMDGATALKFSRSRNAQGDEGTDFARSARQQKVILAIKDKIMNKDFYLHPQKVLGLLKLVQNEIITDIQPEIYGSLAKLGWELNQNPSGISMTALNGNLLIHPQYHYSKQWVLVPIDGSWEEVKDFVHKLLD